MIRQALKENWVFVLILLACSILRLIPLFDYQFTYDELSAFQRIGYPTFDQLVKEGIRIDAHPALLQVFVHYTAGWLGTDTWLFKLPFLLFSLGTMVYLYLTGLKFYRKQVALMLAVVSGFSLVFVHYAPIVRMYCSGMFFSAAMIYYYHHLVGGSTRIRHFVWMGVFAWLSAINHHMNALFALTLMITCFFQLPANSRKVFLFTCLGVVLLYTPHLPITFYQLGLGGIGFEQGGWLEKPLWSAGWDFVRILLGTSRLWGLVLLLVLVSVSQKGLTIKKTNSTLFILFLANYFIIFGYSHLRAPIYQHSVMLFSGMGLLVSLLSLIHYRKASQFYFVLFGYLFILFMKTYHEKDYLHQAVKTVYEYQFQAIEKYGEMVGKEEVAAVLMDTDTLIGGVYKKYYQNRLLIRYSHNEEVKSLKALSVFLKSSKSKCMVMTSANPAQLALLKKYYPIIIENTQTQGINLVVGIKVGSSTNLRDEINAPLYSVTVDKPGDFTFRPSNLPVILDSTEFPMEISVPYNKVYHDEGNMLLVEGVFENVAPSTELVLSASVDDSSRTYSAIDAGSFQYESDSTVTVYAQHYAGTYHRSLLPNAVLKTYIWNRERGGGRLKSLQLMLIDWTPRKWHYWD